MTRGVLVYMVLSVVTAAGCATNSFQMVKTPRYVGYTVASDTSLALDPPPVPPEKASAAIAKLKRIAFVPPDWCLDMRAGDTSTKVDTRVLRMVCGVTMAELEREADRAGFDVVSWQALKGGTRAIDVAREQKVDLMFEVNELDVVDEGNRASSVEFRYFEGQGSGAPVPLKVSPADNARCKAFHAKSMAAISGMTVVLDIKMVQVSNGSVLWGYRHEENMSGRDKSELVKFAVMGKQIYQTKRPWWPWAVVGGGIVVAAAADPVIGGVIVAGGLVASLLVGKKTEAVGAPEVETTSAALCTRAPIFDVPPPVKKEEILSEVYREEFHIVAKDATEERRRELIKKSVGVFMGQLTGKPLAMPPAPPAAPPAS